MNMGTDVIYISLLIFVVVEYVNLLQDYDSVKDKSFYLQLFSHVQSWYL